MNHIYGMVLIAFWLIDALRAQHGYYTLMLDSWVETIIIGICQYRRWDSLKNKNQHLLNANWNLSMDIINFFWDPISQCHVNFYRWVKLLFKKNLVSQYHVSVYLTKTSTGGSVLVIFFGRQTATYYKNIFRS